MRSRPLVWISGVLLVCGCGAYDAAPSAGVTESASLDFAYKADRGMEPTSEVAPPPMVPGEAPAGGEMGGGGMPQDAPPPGEVIRRRIIYDAQIELEIDELDSTAEKLVNLVHEAGGYIAEQSVSGSPGSKRSGRWKVRVPVEQFDGFTQKVLALGELVRNQRTSQDVTEQFYDIQARVKNKKVEEETLLKILDERSGKLEDVLKVEVELSRVRGEIEQLEGRLRVLENLSSLSTVTIDLRERDQYEPAPPVAPTFAERIARTWGSSLSGLRDVGENAVLFVVGIAPWLPLILIFLLVGLLLLRWMIRLVVRWAPRFWEVATRPVNRPAADAGPPSGPRPL